MYKLENKKVLVIGLGLSGRSAVKFLIKRKATVFAVDRDFETLRPDFSAGYTNNMLKRLIYTTPVLWAVKSRADGTLTYDQVGRTARISGEAIELSAREVSLLEIFLQRAGRLVSKDQLVGHLCEWGEEVRAVIQLKAGVAPSDALKAEILAFAVETIVTALLHDVSWSIAPGERWVILGANGAGKTTLLQVIAGAMRPSTGTVDVLGESLDESDLDVISADDLDDAAQKIVAAIGGRH